ncbi:MAG TPA: STM4012 family radical SAM protein [Pirellulales bacterium]|nr:STM4012 family radical SAM protein [Pirellulales bacterium]
MVESQRPTAAVYAGYTYSYPHKRAYRGFDPPLRLDQLWRSERRDSLYLYVHLPFCEMRCGFCNLFTQAQSDRDLVSGYLDALARQARVVRRCVGDMSFARCAIGGGTPTWLDEHQLEVVLDLAEEMGADLSGIPVSVETSPETALPGRLKLLRQRGVDRISIGVQSFADAEVHAVGRPQRKSTVLGALEAIRSHDFPILNLDLMYGLPGQTAQTWIASLEQALAYAPEEIYLYPLYVRPLTALGRRGESWDDERRQLYRQGRDFLLERGYRQCSMRRFRSAQAPAESGPTYSCQHDGMLGLGCGARSYTRDVHYSSDYAVDRAVVREILAHWVASDDDRFALAEFGYQLDVSDRKRRYLLQSLLETDGVAIEAYRDSFGGDPDEDFPELSDFHEAGYLECEQGRWKLTTSGLELSDWIGPRLYSRRVRGLMEACATK